MPRYPHPIGLIRNGQQHPYSTLLKSGITRQPFTTNAPSSTSKGEYFILHDLVLGDARTDIGTDFPSRSKRRNPSYQLMTRGTYGHRTHAVAICSSVRWMTTDLSVTLDGRNRYLSEASRNRQSSMNTLLFPMKPEVNVHPTLSDIDSPYRPRCFRDRFHPSARTTQRTHSSSLTTAWRRCPLQIFGLLVNISSYGGMPPVQTSNS